MQHRNTILIGVVFFLLLEVNSTPQDASPRVSQADAPIRRDSNRSKASKFAVIPKNDEIDWEVDHLGRGRIILPASPVKADITEADVDRLLKHLDDPKTFVTAYVILTRMYNPSATACATVVPGGFDIRYAHLYAQVRYNVQDGADRKTVTFPDHKNFGSQQVNLSSGWNSSIKFSRKGKISHKMRSRKHEGRVHPAWCDNRSFDIKGLTNDRIDWQGYGSFGIRPNLLKVHRDEIALDNRKHVPFLLSLLNDESKFAAAHIALSCILGVDEFCTESPIGRSYKIHLNGLYMVVKLDENGLFQATYPHAGRQQAWIRYRWLTFLEFETK